MKGNTAPADQESESGETRHGFIDAEDARERLTRGFIIVAADAANDVVLPDPEQLMDYFVSLETSESDRAIPTLAFSFLDEMFTQAMLLHLHLSGTSEGFLTGPNGPLASASSRFALAAALGWVSPGVVADLTHLRKIRNLFAHEPSITLEDARVEGHLADHSQSQLIDAMMGDNPPDEIYMDRVGQHIFESPAFDPRLRLVLGAYATAHSALTQIHFIPILQRHGVPLHDLISDPAVELSPQLTDWFESPSRGFERIMDGSSERLTKVRGGPAIDPTVGEIPSDLRGKKHAYLAYEGGMTSHYPLHEQDADRESPGEAPKGVEQPD